MRHDANLTVQMDRVREVVGCDGPREPSCRFVNRPQDKERRSVYYSVEPPVNVAAQLFDVPEGVSIEQSGTVICRISRFDESQPCGAGLKDMAC